MKKEYYRHWIGKMLVEEVDRKRMPRLLHTLQEKDKVLDVACGHGFPYLDTLVKSGFDVSGIDISKELVDGVLRKHPHLENNLVVGDFEKTIITTKALMLSTASGV